MIDVEGEVVGTVARVTNELMAKPMAISDLLEILAPRSAVIFCNTKSDTELVEAFLRRRGIDARRINSDLSQRQRTRIMSKLRSGDIRFLVATDVAARGLDIEHIDIDFGSAPGFTPPPVESRDIEPEATKDDSNSSSMYP